MRIAGTTILLTLYSGSALAHVGAAGGSDLYAGALQALSAPAHLLSFVAIGLLAGQQAGKAQSMLMVFCLALIAGTLVSGALVSGPLVSGTLASSTLSAQQATGSLNLAVTATLGALVATAWSLPGAALVALAAVCGLGLGWASGSDIGPGTSRWLFAPGVAVAGLAVSTYCLMATDFLLRRNAGWMRIAVRVAGSWITAIAILVLAITIGMSLKG